MTTDPLLNSYEKRVNEALEKTDTLDDLREQDEMIDFVLNVGKKLFEKELDQLPPNWLMRHGGRLTGAYAYLGNKSSKARAERDVYEQKRDEYKNELTVKFYQDTEKITHAKAQAEAQLDEMDDLIVQINKKKNDLEHILTATDRMISFIQTALKQKQSENYRGNLTDNN